MATNSYQLFAVTNNDCLRTTTNADILGIWEDVRGIGMLYLWKKSASGSSYSFANWKCFTTSGDIEFVLYHFDASGAGERRVTHL